MRELGKRIGGGVIGGAIGLIAMEIIRRRTASLVKQREPEPTDVFASARSMSPFGAQHEPGESATSALARMGYEKVVGHEPSDRAKNRLSWGVHIAYGLLAAAAYGVVAGDSRRLLRDGVLFGTALWLIGDELAVPLLGLADKPTAYHPTYHLQSFAQHIGFGVGTVATTHLLEGMR